MNQCGNSGDAQPECKCERKAHMFKIGFIHGCRMIEKECGDRIALIGGAVGHSDFFLNVSCTLEDLSVDAVPNIIVKRLLDGIQSQQ